LQVYSKHNEPVVKDKLPERLFAITLTSNRLWGTILLPCILKRSGERDYHTISETLFPFPSSATVALLQPEEQEIVSLINEYGERVLFRFFSKDKNVREFLENVTPEKTEKYIRPYIEKRMYKCLATARDEGVPVFLMKAGIRTIHAEDRLEISSSQAYPLFRFERHPEGSTYSLALLMNGQRISLRNSGTEIICSSPCVIRTGNRIVFVAGTEGSKIKPFLVKEKIEIPPRSEKKYFSTFVLSTINSFSVEASGFKILTPEPGKRACLDIEQGLAGNPVIILRFFYEGRSFFRSEPENSWTAFAEENGEYVFRKYFRDTSWEDDCVKTLNNYGFFAEDQVNFTITGLSGNYDEDLYRTVEHICNAADDLTAAGFTLNCSGTGKSFNLRPVRLVENIKTTEDWFDIDIKVQFGEFEVPFIRLKRHILSGVREYQLPDGSFAVLPEAWFARYKGLLEFSIQKDETIRLHKQHFSLLQGLVREEDRIREALQKLTMPGTLPEAKLPSTIKATLRSYQEEGLRWLLWLRSSRLGGCLADDMGLGKTIQAIALLAINREESGQCTSASHVNPEPTLFDQPAAPAPSLIIVPASLVHNWYNEIKRFAPALKTLVYKGPQRKKSISRFNSCDVILASYHTIRQDTDLISAFHFSYIILDESQAIKNPSSLLFKTVSQLKSDHRLVLTGTPVENSLSDLWTQLSFVNPGLLGSLAFFTKEFARPVEKLNDRKKEEQLKKIISPFILRRTKEMVAADLPPLAEQTVYCDMTDDQAEIYEREKSAVRNAILQEMESEDTENSSIIVLQGLMKLRQISNHPALVKEDYTGGSGKFDTVIRDIENIIAENHKILVFSSFVKHLNLFAGYLSERKTGFSMLTGASTDREKIIKTFMENEANKIFLISLKAGGTGLNLTAADYVFILDPWWNPAAEIQALSRAHRSGQQKSVFVYRYISAGSIEEKIADLQEKKARLAGTFITGSNPLKDVSLKEIIELIG